MRHRWSIPILLALAAVAGYAAGARPVTAQSLVSPVAVGDTVVFSFQDGDSRQCRIEQVRGTFALCGDVPPRFGPTIGRSQQPEQWVNVAVVEWVSKGLQQR